MLQHAATGRLPGHRGAGRLRLFQPPPHSCLCKLHITRPGPQGTRSRPHRLPAPQCPTGAAGGEWAETCRIKGQPRGLGACGEPLSCQRPPSSCSRPCGQHPRTHPHGKPCPAQVPSRPCGWQNRHPRDQQLPGRVGVAGTGHSGGQSPSRHDPECLGPSPHHATRPGDPPKGRPPGQALLEPSISKSSSCPSLDSVSH